MEYNKIITLKNGAQCCLRNGTVEDAQAVLDNFLLTHGETDNLLSYPDESGLDDESEEEFLKRMLESPREIELLAVVDGAVVGTAGVESIGPTCKVRHRAEFGVSVIKEFWGLGIGRALMEACIECAKAAGYLQLELDAVAENTRALAMYEKAGFVEYGRNPKGFLSRITGSFQELVYMRLEL